MRRYGKYALILVGLALCYTPVLIMHRALRFSVENGCKLNDRRPSPCVVDGVDHGERLLSQFSTGWGAVLTFPVAIALIILAIIFIIRDLRPKPTL